MRIRIGFQCGVALAFALGAATSAGAENADAAGIEFFEKRVRPLLIESCYTCHSQSSEKGYKGGLLLDLREGLLKGGDSGPAIVPGNPDGSLLIKAVRYTDEILQMPPNGKKLSPEQIAALEDWVRMGAPDPRTGELMAETSLEQARKHWAFQPIRKPDLPLVREQERVQTPIDAFILARLEEKQMRMSKPAEKRTLLRRAYFDLIGLPPTPGETAEFLADGSPDAFAKVVERLLASPHYGERWARHWLDVARYADTKGYVFVEERRFPYSYTYRDYVIRAFNEDLPFNEFLVHQIAADHLDLGEDKRPLAAMGFLTLGRRFLNNQHDIIDDRIDVVTRGTMGLTVTCARCHDHKYDPVSIQDYYSLYGVFASSTEPSERPLLGANSLPPAYPEYRAEKEKRDAELKTFRDSKRAETLAKVRSQVGEYLLAARDAKPLDDKSKQEALARERKLDPGVLQRWLAALGTWSQEHHPIFSPWIELAGLKDEEFAEKSSELFARFAANADEPKPLNSHVAGIFSGDPPATVQQIAERYGKLFTDTDTAWTELQKTHQENGGENSAAPSALPDAGQEQLRQFLYADGSPANVPVNELQRLFDVPSIERVRALQRKVDELDATHPGAPPRAMSLADKPTPQNPRVFIRGNPGNPGPEVPRQFLEILAGEDRKPFEKGSGRLELAEAIASPENPLTARVLVNRIWLHHFGQGLVRTPSDFGLRADPPSHPELLDYLAARFIEEGWSIKNVHRWIMLSSAYQQSSEHHPGHALEDPNNFLLWKMNRRRLELEPMRDTMLAISGKLDPTAGGQAVDILKEPFSGRRTIYGFIERQNLPGIFRTFDFASPDTTSPQRFYTTVPQQALFLLNSPFVVEQARHLANRSEVRQASSDEEKLRAMFELVLQRPPAPEEIQASLEFIQAPPEAIEEHSAAPVWSYGYGPFDESSGKVKQFTPLPHFTGSAWQGGPKLPDDKLGWAMLNAGGGHAGNTPDHAVIRRWTAPREGTVQISGTLAHDSDKGDGVRGRIVSRSGLLGSWEVHNRKVEARAASVQVARGDTIDFIVDLRTTIEFDSFTWAPVIELAAQEGSSSKHRVQWNAQEDFSGPEKEPKQLLNAWEQYAQVLLMANETVFVD
jgi:hypothetical protein